MSQLTILSDFYRSAFHHNVEEAFNASLKALDIGYIDLYLMHWPQAIVDGILVLVATTWIIISDHVSHLGRTLKEDEHPTFIDTWKSMEKLLETGDPSFDCFIISNPNVK